ncbi:MAG: heme NO-binding protein [Candidatus Eisenbacteria bacterium]|nr:heme NO-binding protein [Candidatus Eisenbacteria bacterium]
MKIPNLPISFVDSPARRAGSALRDDTTCHASRPHRSPGTRSVREVQIKGVINKGIQELVEQRFGADVWQRVKAAAGCDEPFFATSEDYPDESTVALVRAIAGVTEIPAETVQVEFGRFWVPHTGRAAYPSFYGLAGHTPREFLRNLDRIHRQVTRSLRNAVPPRFVCEETDADAMRIHYYSQRGLCRVLEGLILGVGDLFDQELRVREIGCVHQGDDHCTMEVEF